MEKCDLCGAEVKEEKIKHVKIKGKEKKICKGCVTAVKGII